MFVSREIFSRGNILADLGKMRKTRGFFPTRIFPFTVRVDNTSVMGAVRKKQCLKNKILNDLVLAVSDWLTIRRLEFTIKYIRSALNPADGPSRIALGKLSSEAIHTKVLQAVGSFFKT